MEYPKRLEALMEALRVNQTGLAKLLGVSRGIISEFSSGAREPSKDFLIGISNQGVSLDWFVSGDGPMFRDGKFPTVGNLDDEIARSAMLNISDETFKKAIPAPPATGALHRDAMLHDEAFGHHAPAAVREALAEYQQAVPTGDHPPLPAVKNHEHRGVPYYDVEASAHIAEVLEGGDRQPEFYIDFQPFNDCTAYLTVYGDSMYPAIQSGEVIAVKEIRSLDVLLWGEKYLVITNEEANSLRTVKLVHQHEDDSKIILRASNPNFKGDTVIRKESIVKMFLVKGKISRGHL